MNEVETKIAEAIRELDRLLVPLAPNHELKHNTTAALDTLRESLIQAVGRRIIKGNK